MKKFFISTLIFFVFVAHLGAETVWKNIGPEINCREFNCVAVDIHNSDIVYVGTSDGLYKTEDGGLSWKRIFTGWQQKKFIKSIYIKEDRIFLCTDQGLFISNDRGKNWNSSFGIASRSQIFSVAVLNEETPTIFIATDNGVFKSSRDKKEWRRVFSIGNDNANEDLEDLEIENSETTLPRVRAIAVSFNYPSRLYLGTEDGIYISEDKGESFERFSDEGLLDKKILFLIESPAEINKLYAVTKTGAFYFYDGWHNFELAGNLKDTRSIAFDLDPKNSIWIATKRGVYKSMETYRDQERIEIETSNLFSYFNNEPTINEVQEAAIRYAEVHPDKIRDWRRRANISAILPRLSFGIDEDKSDTYEIYTSASSQYIVEGPTRGSTGWDITLTWDLGDLIWSGDQTSIDVRSKLMVQLRDDILDEVTSYYFERRRLEVELLEAAPEDKRDRIKKELRIQELTANLDALTGGYFSRSLK